jgi:hypothetical protein
MPVMLSQCSLQYFSSGGTLQLQAGLAHLEAELFVAWVFSDLAIPFLLAINILVYSSYRSFSGMFASELRGIFFYRVGGLISGNLPIEICLKIFIKNLNL